MTHPGAQTRTVISTIASPVLTLRLMRGLREVAFLGGLYAMYSLTRSLADDSFPRAAQFARGLLSFEATWQLDFELGFNQFVSGHGWLALAMCSWYSSLHFLVTGGVLVWLYFRRRAHYTALRNGLVLATSVALMLYLVLPTAPPRLLGAPFHDVLAETASSGWWGSAHSASGGLGGVANELAAFPSMHAGWALWVAIALWLTAPRWAAYLGLTYAGITAVVVIGTGNHWTIDVLAGWSVVAVAVAATSRAGARSRTAAPTAVGVISVVSAVPGLLDTPDDAEPLPVTAIG